MALGYVRLGDFPANAPLEAAGSRAEIAPPARGQ